MFALGARVQFLSFSRLNGRFLSIIILAFCNLFACVFDFRVLPCGCSVDSHLVIKALEPKMNHAEFAAAAVGAGYSSDDILAGAVIVSDRSRCVVRVSVPSLVDAVDLLNYRFGDNPEGDFTVRPCQSGLAVCFRGFEAYRLRFELYLTESN